MYPRGWPVRNSNDSAAQNGFPAASVFHGTVYVYIASSFSDAFTRNAVIAFLQTDRHFYSATKMILSQIHRFVQVCHRKKTNGEVSIA